MSSIRTGLFANYAGKLAGFLLIAVATPLQIRYLGIASYGVVGLALTLQSLVSLFDFGISATLLRELANRSGRPESFGQSVTIAHRLERTYWLLTLVIGSALVIISPWLAERWLNADASMELATPLALSGLAIVVNLPIGFYAAGLTALQRQVLVNVLYVSGSLVKLGGGIIVAAMSGGSLSSFFTWTLIASGVTVAAYAAVFRLCLPSAAPAPLNHADRATIWRFTLGVSAVSVGLLLMSQADKVLISRIVTVEEFAYYSLAGTVVGGLYLLYQPVVATFAPKLTQSYGLADGHRLSTLYHASTQILSATVFPAAVVIALFAPEVVFLWTRSARITRETAPLVMSLMPGAIAGAAVYMPYSLLRAAGWTAMPVKVLFTTLVMLIPALSIATGWWGPIGAALTWSAFVVIQSAVVVTLLHRRLLPGELRSWLTVDVGLPLAVSLLSCATIRMIFSNVGSAVVMFEAVVVAALITLVAAVLSTDTTRAHALDAVAKARALLRRDALDSPRRG